MSKWQKKTLKVRDEHTWHAKKGYNVIALDRGAVRFAFPRTWIVLPDEDSIKIHDRRPPDDDCVLAVSYLRLSPEIDWSALPLRELVAVANQDDERPIHTWGDIVESRRDSLELAWREMRFVDPNENRAAMSRLCIARQGTVQALITFEFWESDAVRSGVVWKDVLDSLVLNDYIVDPTRGPWGRG